MALWRSVSGFPSRPRCGGSIGRRRTAPSAGRSPRSPCSRTSEPDLGDVLRFGDAQQRLDPAVEVAVHHVGAADQHLGFAAPSEDDYDYTDADVAEGGEIYRTNCAMCHNYAGSGGRLPAGVLILLKGLTQEDDQRCQPGLESMPASATTTTNLSSSATSSCS